MLHDSKPVHWAILATSYIVFLVILVGWILLDLGEVMQPLISASYGLITHLLVLNAIATGVVIGVVILWFGGLTAKDIGLKGSQLLEGVTVGLAFWVLVQITQLLIGLAKTGRVAVAPIWAEEGVGPILGLLLGHLFGTALCEETIFRGFFLPQLWLVLRDRMSSSSKLTVSLAVLISQVLFALMHLPWQAAKGVDTGSLPFVVLAMLFNGIILAIVYLRTGNLFIAIVIHALGNAPTPVLMPFVPSPSLQLVFTLLLLLAWPTLKRWQKAVHLCP